MAEREVRVAHTEALFRDVNERIAESAGRFNADDAEFVCECADPECAERVPAMRTSPAPSIRAASMSSSGIDCMNWVMRKAPKVVTSSIRAPTWPDSLQRDEAGVIELRVDLVNELRRGG